MTAKTFSNGSNARRAAEKMIAAGTAPAVDYGIKRIELLGHSDEGRYEIVWKTTRQANEVTDGLPEETSEAAELAEAGDSHPPTTDEVEAEIAGATHEPAPEPAPAATERASAETAPQSAAEPDAAQQPAPAAAKAAPAGQAMTSEQALGHLGRIADYLNNLLDTHHPLTNEEIESLISDIDAVQEGLQQGLTVAAAKRARRAERTPSQQPRGKSAERDAAAARGVMPEKPVITSAANQHYQKRFDRLAELAGAGDWAAIAAYEVRGYNTYAKEVARYRDRLLAAHAASEKAA
jgi:hypothetical protein